MGKVLATKGNMVVMYECVGIDCHEPTEGFYCDRCREEVQAAKRRVLRAQGKI